MSTSIRATQASLPSAAAVGGWYGGTILVVEGRHDGDRESDGLLHEVQDSTRNQESQVDHDEKWSTCDRGYLFGLQHKDVQNRRGQVTRRLAHGPRRHLYRIADDSGGAVGVPVCRGPGWWRWAAGAGLPHSGIPPQRSRASANSCPIPFSVSNDRRRLVGCTLATNQGSS